MGSSTDQFLKLVVGEEGNPVLDLDFLLCLFAGSHQIYPYQLYISNDEVT